MWFLMNIALPFMAGFTVVYVLIMFVHIKRSNPMPRTFTPHDLAHGITCGQYEAMTEADKLTFDLALVRLWEANAAMADMLYLTGDDDLISTNRRSDLGA